MRVSKRVGLVWSGATDDNRPACLGSCFLSADAAAGGPLGDWGHRGSLRSGWPAAPCRSTASPPCGG